MGTITKTTAAARQLGINYTRLINLIRYGKLDPPGKDSSGDYVWTQADMERARLALAERGRLLSGADGRPHAACTPGGPPDAA
jgi:hypothetical protein